jgi:hypothetical protein
MRALAIQKVPNQRLSIGLVFIGLPPGSAESTAEVVENEIDILVGGIAGNDRRCTRHHATPLNTTDFRRSELGLFRAPLAEPYREQTENTLCRLLCRRKPLLMAATAPSAGPLLGPENAGNP